jgi:hypothetical protein
VSDPLESDAAADAQDDESLIEDDSDLSVLPVLAGPPRIVAASPADGSLQKRPPTAMIPAVQAAAAAAGGFVAGAAVLGLVHRRRRASALSKGRGVGRVSRRGGSRRTGVAGELIEIVGSRSLLVDVHLLGGSGERR